MVQTNASSRSEEAEEANKVNGQERSLHLGIELRKTMAKTEKVSMNPMDVNTPPSGCR